ncbi:hypothetical protein [Campylobacter sp.]|uniref:hypothetical protein n=1 Tax=Campylobacter sp. TaxID=205 RepID=UPI00270C1E9A|nr:hypothetical protein [Campylobacter sp.]
MDRLTQKERAQLEDVFAAIYENRHSKFRNAYNFLYEKLIVLVNKLKKRFCF